MSILFNESANGLTKGSDIVGDIVGQVSVLGLRPDVLHRIEVGSIGRQPLHAEPRRVRFLQLPRRCPMHGPAITDKDESASHVTMDVAKELNHVFGVRIVVQELAVKIEPCRPRCPNQRCQRRDPIMLGPRVLNRRMASASPDTSTKRLQHVPAFVEKNQASIAFGPLFLSAARSGGATARWPLRHAREPDVAASAGSSPVCGATCQHNPRGISLRTIAGSSGQPTRMSNPADQIPRPGAPDPTPPRASAAAPPSNAAADLGVVSARVLVHLVGSRIDASGWPTTHLIQLPQPLPSMTSPAQKAGPRSFDELPTLRGFLWVACTHSTQSAVCNPLTT
jgi:hypothetical protein